MLKRVLKQIRKKYIRAHGNKNKGHMDFYSNLYEVLSNKD